MRHRPRWGSLLSQFLLLSLVQGCWQTGCVRTHPFHHSNCYECQSVSGRSKDSEEPRAGHEPDIWSSHESWSGAGPQINPHCNRLLLLSLILHCKEMLCSFCVQAFKNPNSNWVWGKSRPSVQDDETQWGICGRLMLNCEFLYFHLYWI